MVLVDGTSPVSATRVRQIPSHRALEEALAALARKLSVVFARALVVAHDTLDHLALRRRLRRHVVVVVVIVVAAARAAATAAVGAVQLLRRRRADRRGDGVGRPRSLLRRQRRLLRGV